MLVFPYLEEAGMRVSAGPVAGMIENAAAPKAVGSIIFAIRRLERKFTPLSLYSGAVRRFQLATIPNPLGAVKVVPK